MRTHNRLFIFALFVLASGMPQTTFDFWPFGGGAQAPVPVVVPPKTTLEELIEQGQQFYTNNRGPVLAASVGAVSVLALLAYLNRDRLREGSASREKEHETSEKNQETILKTLVKQIPQLAVVGGVGAYAYKNDLDQVLMKLARNHPVATGCVTGASITAWLTIMYLKNALMENTRELRQMRLDKAHARILRGLSYGFAQNKSIYEMQESIRAIDDDYINSALQQYLESPNTENYNTVRDHVVSKLIENNNS